MIDLRLLNARLLTMDPARPEAEVLAVDQGRIVEAPPDVQARRVIDLKGRWGTPGFTRTGLELPGDESAVLAMQRELLPTGVTAVQAWVDSSGLRTLRSLELGRSLRLRVHAVLGDPDPARLSSFVASSRPVVATGGFEPGGRLSVRAAGIRFRSGSFAIEALAGAARASGWQLLLRCEAGDVEEATALLARLSGPAELRWRVESPSLPETLEGRTRLAAESGFLPGGMLAPGKAADLVVTASDPRLEAGAPLAVMMDGRTAFQSKGLL